MTIPGEHRCHVGGETSNGILPVNPLRAAGKSLPLPALQGFSRFRGGEEMFNAALDRVKVAWDFHLAQVEQHPRGTIVFTVKPLSPSPVAVVRGQGGCYPGTFGDFPLR